MIACQHCKYITGGCNGSCQRINLFNAVGGTGAGPPTMPVNVPFPQWSGYVTIVTLDKDGNVTIKVDQLRPDGEGV